MNVALSVIGKFHVFDLARELHAHGALEAIYTGYPRFKLKGERLPSSKVRSFPWVHTPYMAFSNRHVLGRQAVWWWERLDSWSFDQYVARQLQPCDVFVGLSGSALLSGRAARRLGAKYVCDRGSSHIRVQQQLLKEEHEHWGIPAETLPFASVDPHTVEREELEYAEADAITVPSSFVKRSFVSQGMSPDKIRCLPYGVNLEQFHPSCPPDPDAFDVLFAGQMCLRKGVPYLLQAFKALQHPRKTLTFAGLPSSELLAWFAKQGLWSEQIKVVGHLNQPALRDLMSRSHVLVLPSIEEGLALVQAQALACGCPVIGTPNSGAEDLYADGVEGFIVPIRQVDQLADRLQILADNPDLQRQMRARATRRVAALGGWGTYGMAAIQAYRGLLN